MVEYYVLRRNYWDHTLNHSDHTHFKPTLIPAELDIFHEMMESFPSPSPSASRAPTVQCLEMRGGLTHHWARLWGALPLGETARRDDSYSVGSGSGSGGSEGSREVVSFAVRTSRIRPAPGVDARAIAALDPLLYMIGVGIGSTPGLSSEAPQYGRPKDGSCSMHASMTPNSQLWRVSANADAHIWVDLDGWMTWPDITFGVVCDLTSGHVTGYINERHLIGGTTTHGPLSDSKQKTDPTGAGTGTGKIEPIAWTIPNVKDWYPFAAVAGTYTLRVLPWCCVILTDSLCDGDGVYVSPPQVVIW